jgi:hypothetical protein
MDQRPLLENVYKKQMLSSAEKSYREALAEAEGDVLAGQVLTGGGVNYLIHKPRKVTLQDVVKIPA